MSYLTSLLGRTVCSIMIFGTIAISSNVYAEDSQMLGIEAGTSGVMFGSGGYGQKLTLLTYRYNKNWYYLGGEIGGWEGTRGALVTGWQVGVQYKGLSLGTGLAGINHNTVNLGTSWQILSTLRYTFQPIPVFVSWNHISNGSKIFASPLPNVGENFFTVGYVYRF